jgi:hypothetical protein
LETSGPVVDHYDGRAFVFIAPRITVESDIIAPTLAETLKSKWPKIILISVDAIPRHIGRR